MTINRTQISQGTAPPQKDTADLESEWFGTLSVQGLGRNASLKAIDAAKPLKEKYEWTTIAVLPEGYRPAYDHQMIVPCESPQSGSVLVWIGRDGSLMMNARGVPGLTISLAYFEYPLD